MWSLQRTAEAESPSSGGNILAKVEATSPGPRFSAIPGPPIGRSAFCCRPGVLDHIYAPKGDVTVALETFPPLSAPSVPDPSLILGALTSSNHPTLLFMQINYLG